jgi:hypothetical protein
MATPSPEPLKALNALIKKQAEELRHLRLRDAHARMQRDNILASMHRQSRSIEAWLAQLQTTLAS